MNKVIKVLLSILFVIFAPLSIVFGKEVIVGGDNIGIELDFEGILISGTYDVKYNNTIYNPSRNDIKKGDYIIKIDSNKVNTSKELIGKKINDIEILEVVLL